MKLENLSKKDQNIIAEFLYSFISDILIKNDAERLVKVLTDHNIIVPKNKIFDGIYLFNLIHSKIEEKDISIIMDRYFKNAK